MYEYVYNLKFLFTIFIIYTIIIIVIVTNMYGVFLLNFGHDFRMLCP